MAHDKERIGSVFFSTQEDFEIGQIRVGSRLQTHPFQKQVEQITPQITQKEPAQVIYMAM
jgi:hypothetical protein